MKTNLLRLFLAAIVVVASSALANAQPQFRVIDLGAAAESVCTGPSMNAAGQAFAVLGISGYMHTYQVDANGSRTDIGSLFGWDTIGESIGPGGHIAGISAVDRYGNGWHTFLWTASGGMRDLFPGFNGINHPCGVNAGGDVVGGMAASTARGPETHGFLYSGGVRYDINDLTIQDGGPWLYFGSAQGITDAGWIFGIGTIAATLQLHGYLLIPVTSSGGSLLTNPGLEQSTPPATGPGWVADASRQVLAKSETNQPHSGAQNGACWTTDALDCGLYQDLTAPSTGTYTFTVYANADRSGGFVGANVNGATVAWQAVDVRGFGNFGAAYTMTFTASQGDAIRVWMYSPATPGYVVVDDASLTVQ